jgi:signal transduction histidine kinase
MDQSSAPDRDAPFLGLRRGEQAGAPLKAAIIGGGRACADLLGILSGERLSLLNLDILGVADPDPAAPGLVRAKALGLFTSADLIDLYALPGLNLLIELTGDSAVRERMIRTKPLAVSSMDHRGARLLWDLVQMERELRSLERQAAIGQTVAGLAHCIKNILHGLKGGSFLVERGLERGDQTLATEGWDIVAKGIARVSNLSLDMLSYCKERAPNLRQVDPAWLWQAVLELVGQAAGLEGVQMKVDCQPGSLVRLDPDAMVRALLNLAANAVDACREKAYPAGESPRVEMTVRRRPGEVDFAVADNGAGMDAEVRALLFRRFFSTKQQQGTGLGLAVTHKIVSEHGGRVEVDSAPGRGSTFTITLPA